MTQPPPPPHQPADGNPYAQQPPAGANPYGQQAPGAPYPPQQPVGGAPYAPYPAQGNPFGQQPPPPSVPGRDNIGLGLVAAVVAALVVAGVYGGIIGMTKHEIGWAAVGVGFVIGLAAGKIGGRNPALAVVSAVLALGAVFLGQMIGDAIILTKDYPVTFSEVFFDHFGDLYDLWKDDADPLTFLFFALAAAASFSGAKKAAS